MSNFGNKAERKDRASGASGKQFGRVQSAHVDVDSFPFFRGKVLCAKAAMTGVPIYRLWPAYFEQPW